jgi:hypothetical protein
MTVHIRRGDMKVDLNQLDWFINVIGIVTQVIPQLSITIVTEENFTLDEEAQVRNRFPWVIVTRGGTNTLLADLMTLSSSKIFVASKSHFSALSGYLGPQDGIIIVNEENTYFETHKEIRNNVFTINDHRLIERLSLP